MTNNIPLSVESLYALKLTLTLTAILRAWDRGQISEKVMNIWLQRHYGD